ncbi:SWI/SNF-related matrix-associated actin-dependent regulator of chromatin subfamily A containing DEAD/H box 1 [Octopus bimaculoides]|uniref:DNA helicase n=1 Tax=Octopus bimaculoides TaxID=37653 RepID=A0A0L8G7D1_OCTBM|nr:SWI/SNF-related matrix-associated actin-dependent regulator of chromatin subfamily A containing DEAD/H box 1 [Octopus bimaculoides]|eukprot:XP_014783505.1 PREDICTED: SWI/SNF-related matrix-associated actin-dependent regulator of chromatin subfamily A containing DEAD/H box 1-like [Octopus bimaculoides]
MASRNGKLSTLMQYQFTKTDKEKFSRNTSDVNEEDDAKSQSEDDQSSSETENSKSDKPSPVSDETGNENEKTTNDADSSSDFMKDSEKESDWDSDEHQDWSGKKTTNGYVRKKKRIKKPVKKRRFKRPVSDDNSDDDDDKGHYTTVPKAESNREKARVAELNTLVLLYPHKTRDELGEVLNNSKNLDDAINSMIAADPIKNKKRRKANDNGQQPLKRVKRPSSVDSSSSDLESQEPDMQTIEERIDFLSDAFTAFSREELKDLLRENKWCLEKTIVWLACGDKDKDDPKKKDSDMDEDIPDSESEGSSGDIDLDFEDYCVEKQSEQEIIQSFFNEAKIEELMAIPGCSEKKAEIIIKLRPFESYDSLIEKLDSTKSLTSRFVVGGKEVIHMREVVIRLMKKCEKISKEMGDLANYLVSATEMSEDVQSKTVKELHITQQPLILNENFQLKPYQLVGLNWLRILHSQEVNGILADEMGLGKTVQAIAFLAYLLEQGEEGPHVIIVPSSTIDNWMNEIQRWCPSINVLMYYGSQEDRQNARHHLKYDDHNVNVVLTTYNMATGCLEDRVLFKKTQFHYAVFDEGHMLKNMASLRYQNLMKIQAERRLLLTGTPLQNNLLELISLLCFVMPDMFVGKTEQLKRTFTLITKSQDDKRSNYEMERIAHAKKILRPFMLRRLKSQVLKQMPPKVEEVLYCQMIPDQQEQYENMINQFTKEVDNADGNTRQCMLMQLRKLANHPLLQRRHFTNSLLRSMSTAIAKEPSHRERNALPSVIYQDMEVMSDFELHKLCLLYKKHLGHFALNPSVILDSGKFRKMDELLPDFREVGDRVLIFSQFTMVLDILEEYLKLKEDMKYLRLDGQTPVQERQGLINKFNENPEIFIFLLSTRAGGLGINLSSANAVIIHDIDFNPYNDKQAEDRCHRMGQTKAVKICRLLSKNTVEEAMFRCAQKKLSLEKDVTSSSVQHCNTDEPEVDVASILKEVLASATKK